MAGNPEWLKPYQFGPGNKAGRASGTKHRLMALWDSSKQHAYDAEYTAADGSRQKWRITSPFDTLLFIATTGQDPRVGFVNAKLGNKSPFSEANQTTITTRAEAKGATDSETKVARLLVNGFLSTDDWLNAIRLLQPYMMARLASIEVTGEDGAPLAANVDVVKQLSRLPGMRRMMEHVQTEASRIIEQPEEVVEMVPDGVPEPVAALLEGGTGETSGDGVERPEEPGPKPNDDAKK
jgi:hypothetical protein